VDDDDTPLDSNWIKANPLPQPSNDADKNERGRVVVIGGSSTVPGGIALTAEAALRAGAEKVRVGTVASAALGIGLALPEVAMVSLGETAHGEIDIATLDRLEPSLAACDAIVAGPAMGDADTAGELIGHLLTALGAEDLKPAIIFDAAALQALPGFAQQLRDWDGPILLTPHIGELAAMLECDASTIDADPRAHLRGAAERYRATVILKGATTFLAGPDAEFFAYAGGGVGLATGGSGDVLAGIADGLCARGCSPRDALLWAVWLHGEAGRRCAEHIGPLGYLARELLSRIPSLMRGA
jgi:ADP-dependent NAD(P)H-hydrate dehydratase